MSVSADTAETAIDTQYLNDTGVCPDRRGSFCTGSHRGEVSETADKSWEKWAFAFAENKEEEMNNMNNISG